MELEPLFKCKQLENDQDLHDSVLCIKDSNSYHSPTNLSELKHGEKWIQTVTAILEILKINVIEEMEHLFIQKRDYFQQSLASKLFFSNQRLADMMSTCALAYTMMCLSNTFAH